MGSDPRRSLCPSAGARRGGASMTSQAVIEKAKKLAEAGFVPIPLNGKAPTLVGWDEVPRVDAAMIDSWVAQGKMTNVGLRTGDRGLVVLDFDGMAGYQSFVKAFGELADTYSVATGSGDGMHVY